jgi:hypothetical protein
MLTSTQIFSLCIVLALYYLLELLLISSSDAYIISCVLVGSLLILAGGNISYIDALFFATGACTQAGLNTIDVNKLNTWQQV